MTTTSNLEFQGHLSIDVLDPDEPRLTSKLCYNCGEFANHIAAKCSMGPQPKRCHNCKSVDHLIADCPTRQEGTSGKKKSSTTNNNNNSCDNKNNDDDDDPLCHTAVHHLGNG
ncbi:hypothetical protein AVEN_241362-1, partial [Araneus ventricosus]